MVHFNTKTHGGMLAFLSEYRACSSGYKWAARNGNDLQHLWARLCGEEHYDWHVWVATCPGVLSKRVQGDFFLWCLDQPILDDGDPLSSIFPGNESDCLTWQILGRKAYLALRDWVDADEDWVKWKEQIEHICPSEHKLSIPSIGAQDLETYQRCARDSRWTPEMQDFFRKACSASGWIACYDAIRFWHTDLWNSLMLLTSAAVCRGTQDDVEVPDPFLHFAKFLQKLPNPFIDDSELWVRTKEGAWGLRG